MRNLAAIILALLIMPCAFADSSKTVPYDSTVDNDYELPDDLTIQDTDPHLKLDATSGDDFEAYVSNSRFYISNTTDSRVMLTFDGGTGVYLPNLTNCNTIDTDANGLLSCGTDATGAGGGDAITVNSSAATDPDFANGDVDWTLTGGNSITATVGCADCVALTTETSGNYVGSIGNCTGSEGAACFTGTDGDTLTFNDADGDQTFKYDTTANDFAISDDVTITDATPHVQLVDSTGSQDDFEIYAEASEFYLTNVTDGKVHLRVSANDQLSIPQVASCQSLKTDAAGLLSCQTVTAPTFTNVLLLPQQATLDDSAPPDVTVVESTGTGTPRRIVADFDPTTEQFVYWTVIVPSDATTGTWYADISWYANDIGAGENPIWEAQVSCTSEGDADAMSEDAAAATSTIQEVTNATEANRLVQSTLTFSNMDSCAAGDVATITFSRNAADAGDDLTSDARLVAVNLRIPRT